MKNIEGRDSKKSSFYYGWVIVVAAWMLYFINVALPLYGGAVLNALMLVDLQYNAMVIGLAASLCTAVQALTVPFVAMIIKRKGIRPAYIVGVTLLLLSSVGLAFFATNQVAFLLLYGGGMGLSMSFGGTFIGQNSVFFWFKKHRSLALAIVVSAGSAGGFLAAPLMGMLTKNGDWTVGWKFVAASSVLAIILAVFVIKNRPEDIGQHMDGQTDEEYDSEALLTDAKKSDFTLKQAIKTKAYRVLLFGNSMRMLFYYACIAHIIIHTTFLGHSMVAAQFTISAITISSFVGRLLVGAVGDRKVSAIRLCALGDGSMGLGAILLVLDGGILGIYAASICIGLGLGLGLVAVPLCVQDYFGAENFAPIQSTFAQTAHIATSIGSITAGICFDLVGTYTPIFIIFGMANLVAFWFTYRSVAPLPPQSNKMV